MARRLVLLAAAGALLVGCGADEPAGPAAPEPSAAAESITVTSPAFGEGGSIPAAYTCAGAGTSPELRWSGVPADAQALALVVDDPDAPNGYVHWVVVDIPVSTPGVPAGQAPEGGTELRGSQKQGWSPPCPPSGTHHYRFHVYALRAPLQLASDTSAADAMDAIDGQAMAWGLLTATVSAAADTSGGGY